MREEDLINPDLTIEAETSFLRNDDSRNISIERDYERFNYINCINANARSLNNKIGSLVELFEEYELSFALLTETWFSSGEKLKDELVELEEGENIGMIARNRPGRGGGVAIAFKSSCLTVKEFKLPNNKFEMVCGVGNFTNTNRKIAIVSVYIPPRQKAATTQKMKECLSEGIHKIKMALSLIHI